MVCNIQEAEQDVEADAPTMGLLERTGSSPMRPAGVSAGPCTSAAAGREASSEISGLCCLHPFVQTQLSLSPEPP